MTTHHRIRRMLTYRSTAFIIILFLLATSCQSTRDHFSFVQLSDPQLGMGGYEHDMKTLGQAVRQINEMDSDFVVICGDLVHHASDSAFGDFFEIIDELNIPYYLVPGNHDIGNVPNDSTLDYYRKTVGEDYYAFRHKGYAFIATNSLMWKNDIEGESENHDSWFKQTLEETSADQLPVIVIGHFPIYVNHPDEEEQYFNLPSDKREELLDLFIRGHVVAYLSGHKHETIIHQYRDILLVTGETTSKNFDQRPMGFRYWEVSGDSLSHHFVPLDN